ncbi:MAG: hypothetical protein LH632_08505 [Rhodoferax sp.]|nr:hypothetical protein [Rhodoferax sp.]
MKFLLVVAVVLIGFWIWRSGRKARNPPPKAQTPQAIDMVRCDRCGVHCAKPDLVVGKAGVYCTVQHRDQSET